jgi:hypothetical protein
VFYLRPQQQYEFIMITFDRNPSSSVKRRDLVAAVAAHQQQA